MIDADTALQRLREGNRRFAAGRRSIDTLLTRDRREQLAARQEPFAIILGCADSRVPAEIVFDQGVGDLFVIRVAGNIVAPSLIGSIEFAASRFGTRLVVVLGHSQCGAVQATVEELRHPGHESSRNIQDIVNRIRPSVEGLMAKGAPVQGDEELVGRAVRANVCASVDQLQGGSAILEDLIVHQGLKVVGAEYSLESGVVDFFCGG